MRRIYPLIIGVLVLALPVRAEAPEDKQISTLNDCFLRAKTSGQEQAENYSLFSGLKYKTLIKCIAWYESSYRTNVYGDSGAAYGIMQFHRPTFDQYCEGNYYDPRDQVVCADRMISDNWWNITHWTTYPNCI